MVFILEHETFLIESYFLNGTKVRGVWAYSVQNCIEEFQAGLTNFAVDYIQFRKLWTELLICFVDLVVSCENHPLERFENVQAT
jgi:hypothetical protein